MFSNLLHPLLLLLFHHDHPYHFCLCPARLCPCRCFSEVPVPCGASFRSSDHALCHLTLCIDDSNVLDPMLFGTHICTGIPFQPPSEIFLRLFSEILHLYRLLLLDFSIEGLSMGDVARFPLFQSLLLLRPHFFPQGLLRLRARFRLCIFEHALCLRFVCTSSNTRCVQSCSDFCRISICIPLCLLFFFGAFGAMRDWPCNSCCAPCIWL